MDDLLETSSQFRGLLRAQINEKIGKKTDQIFQERAFGLRRPHNFAACCALKLVKYLIRKRIRFWRTGVWAETSWQFRDAACVLFTKKCQKSNLHFTSQRANRNVIMKDHKHYHEQYLDLYNRYHWSCLFPSHYHDHHDDHDRIVILKAIISLHSVRNPTVDTINAKNCIEANPFPKNNTDDALN